MLPPLHPSPPCTLLQEAIAAKSWLQAKTVQLGTAAVVGVMSRTWLHPLFKKMVPAQGEVRARGVVHA